MGESSTRMGGFLGSPRVAPPFFCSQPQGVDPSDEGLGLGGMFPSYVYFVFNEISSHMSSDHTFLHQYFILQMLTNLSFSIQKGHSLSYERMTKLTHFEKVLTKLARKFFRDQTL